MRLLDPPHTSLICSDGYFYTTIAIALRLLFAQLLESLPRLCEEWSCPTAPMTSDASSLYQAALNALPDPVVVVAPSGEVVVCNRAWRHLVGQRDGAAEICLGMSYDQAHQALCAQAAPVTLQENIRAVSGGTLSTYSDLCRCVFPKRVSSFRVRVTPLADGHEGCLVSYRDITEQQQREDLIRHEANHDPLTGLPNRRLFFLEAEKVLALAKRSERAFALLYLDLDGFKAVNDSNGHETGDWVLCEVAARLTLLSRDSDLLARLGGDEFLILLQDVTLEQGHAAAERYRWSLAQPFKIDGVKVSLRGSFGIARYPEDSESISDLVQCADRAMYQAKAAGGGIRSYA